MFAAFGGVLKRPKEVAFDVLELGEEPAISALGTESRDSAMCSGQGNILRSFDFVTRID
jgi:hypothetical protein